MSYFNMWVHLSWSTKYREPILTEEVRNKVLGYIKQQARSNGIVLDQISGLTDHVHCLIFLKPDQSVSQVAKLIKGESAFWVNQQRLFKEQFGWQREFFASTVGESDLNKVRRYIQNQ